MASASADFWRVRGYGREGRQWLEVFYFLHAPIYFHGEGADRAMVVLEQALALYREIGDMNGIALCLQGMGNITRDQESREVAASLYQQALAVYRQLEDTDGIASILAESGYMHSQPGTLDVATTLLEENLILARACNNKVSIAHGLWLLGRVKEMRGEFAAAAPLFEESIAIAQAIGAKQQVANSMNNLEILAELQQDYETALNRYKDALAVMREMNHQRGIPFQLAQIARTDLYLTNCPEAAGYARESLQWRRETQPSHHILTSLLVLGCAAAVEADWERAATLLGAVEGIRETQRQGLSPEESALIEKYCTPAKHALGKARFMRAWNGGKTLPADQAVAYALHELAR